MKKLNNKGFLLIETVVVAVFVLAIFVLLLQNGLPLVIEYEKRSYYDDIDSVYATNLIRHYIKTAKYDIENKSLYDEITTKLDSVPYFEILTESSDKYSSASGNYYYKLNDDTFDNLKKSLYICNDCKIIVTRWNTSELKANLVNGTGETGDYSRGLAEYIGYLYKNAATEKNPTNNYRLIITRKVKDEYFYSNVSLDLVSSEYNEKNYLTTIKNRDNIVYLYQLSYKYYKDEIKSYTITATATDPSYSQELCEKYATTPSERFYTKNYSCKSYGNNYTFTYEYDEPIQTEGGIIRLELIGGTIHIPSIIDQLAFETRLETIEMDNSDGTTTKWEAN